VVLREPHDDRHGRNYALCSAHRPQHGRSGEAVLQPQAGKSTPPPQRDERIVGDRWHYL